MNATERTHTFHLLEGMGVIEEVDFPRGGAPIEAGSTASSASVKKSKVKNTEPKDPADNELFPSRKRKEPIADKSFPNKKQKKDSKKKDEDVELVGGDVKYKGVWRSAVSDETFTDGVMGLGCVREVTETYIVLETSDAKRVSLPANQVSKKFTAALIAQTIALDDAFTPGQLVPFRVIKKANKQQKGRYIPPTVTCEPARLNSHLAPAMLKRGLVLISTVESVEEKGAILDLGLQSLKGFLPKTSFPEGLREALPLLVRIESADARTVRVTTAVETDTLCTEATEKLQLNQLMPGTILLAEPEKATAGGVYVNLGNDVKAFVHRRHLPPRLRADMSRMARAVRVVVTMCQQNTALLVLSAHPDIVAVSKPEKRTTFQGIDEGDVITCIVSDVSKGSVHFDLPEDENGKASLVTAVAYGANIDNDAMGTYKVGDEVQCRVMSYRMVERLLIVSSKKSVINQKMVSFKDAVPGDVVTAEIKKVGSFGLIVSIYGMVKGFVHVHHVSDKANVDLDKTFKEGQKIQCRVLDVNEDKKSVVLTARPCLVEYKGKCITELSDDLVGEKTMGMVKFVTATGGLIVQLYNGIAGFVQHTDAARIGNLKIGDVVEVSVKNVDMEKERILLGLADGGMAGTGNAVVKPQPIKWAAAGGRLYAGVSGELEETAIGGKKREYVNVTIAASGKEKEVTAQLSSAWFTDALDGPQTLKGVLGKGQKLEKIAPLGAVNAINRVTAKRFVRDWLAAGQHVPKEIGELAPGQLVCGVVSQRIAEKGYFVELVGGSGLVGRVNINTVNEGTDGELAMQTGQTVVAKVTQVDSEKKQFSLSLKTNDCFPEGVDGVWMGEALLRSCVEEQQWLAAHRPAGVMPLPGSAVQLSIVQKFDDSLIVAFGKSGNGVVRAGNFPAQIKAGDKVEGTLIDYVFPHFDAELVISKAGAEKKKGKKLVKPSAVSAGAQLDGRVVLVKRDYVAVLVADQLCFVPSRFHPNEVVGKIGRVALGDSVKVTAKEQIGSVWIGLLDGDDKLVETMKSKVSTSKSKLELVHKGILRASDVGLKVKPFEVVSAVVQKEWPFELKGDFGRQSVLLSLPGGLLGRMHVSELPSSLLVPGTRPLDVFLARNKGKTVTVKIIKSYSPAIDGEKTKLLDCTMNDAKLNETRKKGKYINYTAKFNKDDEVAVFIGEMKGLKLKVEVNPDAEGFVPRERLDAAHLLRNETDGASSLVDVIPEAGTMYMAKVMGVISQKNKINLDLSLNNDTKPKKVSPGDKLVGRVIEVKGEPAEVRLQLQSGHRAVIPPTALTSLYTNLTNVLAKFHLNELYHVYLIGQQPGGDLMVATEGRYESAQKAGTKTPMLTTCDQVKKGQEVKGVVLKTLGEESLLVELGPGLRAAATAKGLATLPSANSVVKVRVLEVNAEAEDEKTRIVCAVTSVMIGDKAPVAVQDETNPRKRERKESETKEAAAAKKTKDDKKVHVESEKEVVPVGEKIEISDPGFDFSNKGFTPAELASIGKLGEDKKEESEDEAMEPVEEKKEPKKKADKKEKKKLTKEESDVAKEKGLLAKEAALLDTEREPETDDDFARLLKRDPNSADLWIKYMTMFIAREEVGKARAAAERALVSIHYREEAELFNVWTAYLNMEMQFGDESSVKAVFERACGNADSFKMHKQMAAIYANADKNEQADAVFELLVKKFRANSDEVWTLYGEHFMSTERAQQARDLMQRALTSVPKQRHTQLISRFAQLEMKHGDAERANTLFESLVAAYPKKTDIWMVWADLALKHSGAEKARSVLERATGLQLSVHKLRPFFKKWMELEEKHGDDKSQAAVRQRAQTLLKDAADSLKL